jgi:hypothetical protein
MLLASRPLLTGELDGFAVSALQRVIAEVNQHWSVFGWVTKNLLFRFLCASEGTLSRWSRLLFAVVSTHQSAQALARSLYV